MSYIKKNQMCYAVIVVDPLSITPAPISARVSIVTLSKAEAIRYCELEMIRLEDRGYEYSGEYTEGAKSTVIYDKPGFTAAVIFSPSALIV